ncbi:MAG: glucose 1-dehydrogenase [Calditrichaeota bacterium]|nr:MAG: SDR family NAD(P)-dependent oxidoreductase [Calditrichota bacterium]MBL1205876.1 glucose 1-dehydrogenase [Calditrichota bacterium]NOG45704.1 3-oxoacyl-ACP reductase FabG [Calditrichota bacterium]
MLDFTGKTVLVTGGSRGIGAATVRAFASRGANVAFNYNKNYRAADLLKQECEKYGGKIFFMECDVSAYNEVELYLKKMAVKLDSVDILVNNAGIWSEANIDNFTVDLWRKTIQVNLDSVFYFTTLIARQMREKNISGSIINISSTAGQVGEKNYSHYAASKGGIISFTKSVAQELGPDGIRVNCIAPGWIETDMTEEYMKHNKKSVKKNMPLGFIPEPDDIANGILFLASDMARAITGEILNINGGSVLCG